MHYDSIGKSMVQRSKLSDLSGREMVNLFNDLMDELGITKRIQNEPEGEEIKTERFKKIWQEQTDKAWGKETKKENFLQNHRIRQAEEKEVEENDYKRL